MILDRQPDHGEKWKSLALAAAVHLALVVALVVGVHWKTRTPASVEVELWDQVPSRPAPPPPEPRPEPKPEAKPEPKPEPKVEPKPVAKPDIAIKDDKKKKEKPPEPPKKDVPKPPEPKKPEPKPEQKKLEPKPEPRPSFDEELKREQKQLDQQKHLQQQATRAEAETRAMNEAKAEQAAAARNRGLADYAGKIRGKIRGNTVLPQGIQGNPEALVEITQLPSGEVISVRLKKSSGNANLDAAVERAILKSSPLPKPDQPGLFERVLEIKYRPFDE